MSCRTTNRRRDFRANSFRTAFGVGVLLLLATRPVRAQAPRPPADANPPEAVPPLEPDRPDVTNGTHIVDVGLVQMEVGVLFSKASGERRNTATPITARVGLSDWLELRIGGDGWLVSNDPQGHQSGIGNVQLGMKLRLWADPGGIPVLSVLPTVNLPTASEAKGLGSGQADVTVAVLTGTDIRRRGHIDVNYGIGLIGAGTGLARFAQHLISVSASAEIPGPVTPYVEAFWISRQDPDGGSVVATDAGAIYVLSPRWAIDGGLQVGLSPSAPTLAAFGGLSVVVGSILGEHGVHARQRQAAKRGPPRAR
jgi:outer membrane putative beta-barrel porin/alpha-amylase